MPISLADNVSFFLNEAAVAKARADIARIERGISKFDIQSPIEQIFYAAFSTLCGATGTPVFEEENFLKEQGFRLQAQAVIDMYRVDFVVSQRYLGPDESPVIVELDGHPFHDKDKFQRAYEKGRDRHLVARGYRVLHFTGSEVVADAFRVAHEVLNVLTSNDIIYNPAEPLGRGSSA